MSAQLDAMVARGRSAREIGADRLSDGRASDSREAATVEQLAEANAKVALNAMIAGFQGSIAGGEDDERPPQPNTGD